jgi:alpha-mannosidase
MLVPHKGSWKDANIVRTAEEFIAPPNVVYQGIHAGNRPKSASFLSVNPSNILVSSIKKSEIGDDLIIRCVETNESEDKSDVAVPADGETWTVILLHARSRR